MRMGGVRTVPISVAGRIGCVGEVAALGRQVVDGQASTVHGEGTIRSTSKSSSPIAEWIAYFESPSLC